MADEFALSVPEAARRVGASVRTIHTLIARGELASQKIGRWRPVLTRSLEALPRRDHASPVGADDDGPQ